MNCQQSGYRAGQPGETRVTCLAPFAHDRAEQCLNQRHIVYQWTVAISTADEANCPAKSARHFGNYEWCQSFGEAVVELVRPKKGMIARAEPHDLLERLD